MFLSTLIHADISAFDNILPHAGSRKAEMQSRNEFKTNRVVIISLLFSYFNKAFLCGRIL